MAFDGNGMIMECNYSFHSIPANLGFPFCDWQVDLLKHSIPDPSSLSLSHPQSSNLGSDKEVKDKIQEVGEEYMASPVFVHTK